MCDHEKLVVMAKDAERDLYRKNERFFYWPNRKKDKRSFFYFSAVCVRKGKNQFIKKNG